MASRSSQDIYAETLAVFDQNEQRYEPLTTPEVSDALDAKRRTVYKRLQKLVDRGKIKTKKTGSNSRVWWRPPAGSTMTSDVDGEQQSYTTPGSLRRDTPRRAGNTEQESLPQSAERPQGRYREIFETIPDGVTLHDPTDGTLIDVNQQYCEMLGYTRDELLASGFEGLHANEPPYTRYRAKQYIQRAATEGPQTFEWLDQTKAGEQLPVKVHLQQTTIDGDDYILAVVRDITDRKEQEKELERRSRAMESAIDGMAILNDDGEYTYVNETHVDVYGYDDREAFIGEHWGVCYTEAERPRFEDDILPTLYEDGEWRGEAIGQRKDGTTFPQELSLTVTDDGDIICVVRDITDRKEREQEVREKAQQLQGVLDTVEATIFLKDMDGQYLLMNQNCRELVGIDADEDVAGLTDDELFPEDIADQYRMDDDRMFEANETIEIEEEVPMPDGTKTHLTRKTPIFDEDGDPYAVCAVSTDIAAQKERERELRATRRFNEELVENAPFGMYRLDEDLRITYENPKAKEIVGVPDDKEASAAIGMDIRELPSIVETGQADIFTRLKDGEMISFEFSFESIYGREAYFTGRGVPLYRDDEFNGALLMVNDISERRQQKRALEHQRDQLAVLNQLNDVVQEISEAVINQSTREEIEQVVCNRLANTDSYRFAWISGANSKSQLEPRVEAGIDGYLDDIPLSAASDGATGQGPAGKAARTQEIQVIQNALDDPEFEPLPEHAREYEYRSSAAIPLVHNDTLYGVLGIYSERPEAFAEQEREVIGQLGEVVGHAIAALNRKRALMSDEAVELEIRIPSLLESQNISVTTDGTITFKRTVPLGDDEYLMYGTATADAMEVIYALGEQLPAWKAPQKIAESDGGVRFEQHLSEEPMASIVAEHGGYFKVSHIENGAFSATIHLPPETDVRQFVAGIRETYPDVKTISKQQVTRKEPSPRQLPNVLGEKLTERQRAALETSYFGGFFDWPRKQSGEQLAESLDIGASTFHQHVRKAEKKLLDVVFTEI